MEENFLTRTNDLKTGRGIRSEVGRYVIVASLLEEESATEKDHKIVSGIIWKRLKMNMPLQIDATLGYITGKRKS